MTQSSPSDVDGDLGSLQDNTTPTVLGHEADNLFVGQIGDKQIAIKYEQGQRGYAQQRFDKDLAAYEDACEIVATGKTVLISELENTYKKAEIHRVDRCQKCGYEALKERRGRMRVFGGLFWTDSKVSPYRTCERCGHDQEITAYKHRPTESFERDADMRLQRAMRLKAKYEVSDLKLKDLNTKTKGSSESPNPSPQNTNSKERQYNG